MARSKLGPKPHSSEEEEEDEAKEEEHWTTVSRTGKKNFRRVARQKQSKYRPRELPVHSKQKEPTSEDVDKLEATLRDYHARYKASTFHGHVTRMLARETGRRERIGGNGVEIDVAVCLALGPPSDYLNPERMTLARSSAWQFAFFMEVVKSLEGVQSQRRGMGADEGSFSNGVGEESDKAEIKMIAQDPRFQELDRQVLKRFGVQVVEDPAATAYVTETSFLYAPFMDWRVLLGEILPWQHPVLYIGNSDIVDSIQHTVSEDEVGGVEKMRMVAKDFAETRNERKILKKFDIAADSNAFRGQSFYWRIGTNDDEDEDDEEDERDRLVLVQERLCVSGMNASASASTPNTSGSTP